jgi:hypothetical protein
MSYQGGGGVRWDAMSVREYTDRQGQQRTYWTKVGSGFTNKDGSIGIQLDALPLDGRIVLQIPLTKEQREAKFQQRQQGYQQQRGGGWSPQQRTAQQPQRTNAQRFNQPPQPQPPAYDPGEPQGGMEENPFGQQGDYTDEEIPH